MINVGINTGRMWVVVEIACYEEVCVLVEMGKRNVSEKCGRFAY